MASSPLDLAVLERRRSVERMAPYRRVVGDDLARAIVLYEWNTAIAAAFWATLCDVEVVIRNAMHERLSEWSIEMYQEPRWYLAPGRVLTAQAGQAIADARRHASKNGRHETPGRVVAELALGFWRFLLAARYERVLWLPCLRAAFPQIHGRGMRRDVYYGVARLHLMRNRIAHHEPVHNRPLWELHRTALTVVEWVCPGTRRWIERRSTVDRILAAGPAGRPLQRSPTG